MDHPLNAMDGTSDIDLSSLDYYQGHREIDEFYPSLPQQPEQPIVGTITSMAEPHFTEAPPQQDTGLVPNVGFDSLTSSASHTTDQGADAQQEAGNPFNDAFGGFMGEMEVLENATEYMGHVQNLHTSQPMPHALSPGLLTNTTSCGPPSLPQMSLQTPRQDSWASWPTVVEASPSLHQSGNRGQLLAEMQFENKQASSPIFDQSPVKFGLSQPSSTSQGGMPSMEAPLPQQKNFNMFPQDVETYHMAKYEPAPVDSVISSPIAAVTQGLGQPLSMMQGVPNHGFMYPPQPRMHSLPRFHPQPKFNPQSSYDFAVSPSMYGVPFQQAQLMYQVQQPQYNFSGVPHGVNLNGQQFGLNLFPQQVQYGPARHAQGYVRQQQARPNAIRRDEQEALAEQEDEENEAPSAAGQSYIESASPPARVHDTPVRVKGRSRQVSNASVRATPARRTPQSKTTSSGKKKTKAELGGNFDEIQFGPHRYDPYSSPNATVVDEDGQLVPAGKQRTTPVKATLKNATRPADTPTKAPAAKRARTTGPRPPSKARAKAQLIRNNFGRSVATQDSEPDTAPEQAQKPARNHATRKNSRSISPGVSALPQQNTRSQGGVGRQDLASAIEKVVMKNLGANPRRQTRAAKQKADDAKPGVSTSKTAKRRHSKLVMETK